MDLHAGQAPAWRGEEISTLRERGSDEDDAAPQRILGCHLGALLAERRHRVTRDPQKRLRRSGKVDRRGLTVLADVEAPGNRQRIEPAIASDDGQRERRLRTRLGTLKKQDRPSYGPIRVLQDVRRATQVTTERRFGEGSRGREERSQDDPAGLPVTEVVNRASQRGVLSHRRRRREGDVHPDHGSSGRLQSPEYTGKVIARNRLPLPETIEGPVVDGHDHHVRVPLSSGELQHEIERRGLPALEETGLRHGRHDNARGDADRPDSRQLPELAAPPSFRQPLFHPRQKPLGVLHLALICVSSTRPERWFHGERIRAVDVADEQALRR